MSTQPSGNARRMLNVPELPTGEIISTYDHYLDAKEAVDRLARANFPVREVTIMGNDVRSVERVTGKLTYGKVALRGVVSGAYFGLFIGIIMFLFQPDNGAVFGVFLAAIAIGAGFGMLFSVISYAINTNRRDYSSVMQFVAARYDLITRQEYVHPAREILMSPEQK